MEKEKFLNGEQAIEIIKSLASSQGFYGRLLAEIKEFTEEQKKNLIK